MCASAPSKVRCQTWKELGVITLCVAAGVLQFVMGGLCLGVIPSFYFVAGKHGIIDHVFPCFY